MTQKETVIDKQLLLVSDVQAKELCSKSNHALYVKRGGKICLDDFSHEQNLIISEGEHKILIAGCSHAGIVNIKATAESILDTKLTHVIAGFHLYNPVSRKQESESLVQEIAERF